MKSRSSRKIRKFVYRDGKYLFSELCSAFIPLLQVSAAGRAPSDQALTRHVAVLWARGTMGRPVARRQAILGPSSKSI